ncbi:MAG: hypothetical protein ABI663_17675 [Chryseolinea sp.]
MKTLNFLLAIFAFALLVSTSGCDEEGCTDSKALNQDFTADKDNGSCTYSTAVFYGSIPSPFPPVTVTVNGSTVGTISAYYPSGPGNCSVPGVATFQFDNGEKVDWVVTDAIGNIFSGTLEPNSFSDCLKVRVY